MEEAEQNNNADKQALSLREKIVFSLTGIGLLGGGAWAINHWFKKKKSNKAENKSAQDGSPETYAKGLKMAFENDGWFGTNTPEVRRVLEEIKTKEDFVKVQQAYQKLYNANLLSDMSGELQSSEYNEMVQIISVKPSKNGKALPASVNYTAWAKRFKAAFEKTYAFIPGTDEKAIQAICMEMPSKTAFVKTGVTYQKLYGTALMDDMQSELSSSDYLAMMKIITQKPK